MNIIDIKIIIEDIKINVNKIDLIVIYKNIISGLNYILSYNGHMYNYIIKISNGCYIEDYLEDNIYI